MSFNQACQKHYSDKVSKVVIFGPISNFARSLQAAPLKYFVPACHKLPQIFGSREAILEYFSKESHMWSFLDTIVYYMES